MTPRPSERTRVLVVGGGHASLPLLRHARELVALGADVTLLTDAPALWYSGMTPEWLGGVYTRADATVPFAPICDREGVRLQLGRAVALDRSARTVTTSKGAVHGYDVAVFDIGGVNPAQEAAGPAVRTKPLHRISELGEALDAAARERSAISLVIVGGGAAGVETALNVSARADLAGLLTLIVVEPGDRLVASLPSAVGKGTLTTLRRRNVEVLLGASVEAVDGGGVGLKSGARRAADAVLWATGTVGHPLFAAAGLDVSEAGFVHVEANLRTLRDDRLFVAGDAALVQGHETLARVGVHAVKQGPVLRRNVRAMVQALQRTSHRAKLASFSPYPATPLIVSTGTAAAWLAVGPLAMRSRGWLALKHAVDRRWIDRYRDPAQASYARHWDLASADDPLRASRPANR